MKATNSVYLNEITGFSLLTREEEKALAKRAFNGDLEARDTLVKANLRFVVKIAGQYKNSGLEMEELISEGNVGLIKAAEKYNPDSDAKFTTYAVFLIHDSIRKAIRETSKGVKFPAGKYKEMYKDEWNFASLDKTVNSEDSETTLGSLIEDDVYLSPEEEYYQNSLLQNLPKKIRALSNLEQTVISLNFGLNHKDPMSLTKIGEITGYSKERIRQIRNEAVNKLYESFSA